MVAYCSELLREVAEGCGDVVLRVLFARINFIFGALGKGCDVGHHYIGARENAIDISGGGESL